MIGADFNTIKITVIYNTAMMRAVCNGAFDAGIRVRFIVIHTYFTSRINRNLHSDTKKSLIVSVLVYT